MSKFKVYATDITWPDLEIEKDILKDVADVTLSTGKNTEEICAQGNDADGLMVLFTPMNRENLSHFKNAKILLRTGIGTNSVDLDAATEMGIIVCNVPDYCQEEVADHTMALFLDITRKMVELVNQTRNGGWNMSIADPVPRYRNKIFALAGCGGIGRMVAHRAQAFGLQTIGYDPYLPEEVFAKNNIRRCATIDELLKEADFVSLHMPLTPESTHVIDARALSLMKPSAYLINSARGPLVDEDALYEACKNKQIAGAALDVTVCEPPAGHDKFVTKPKFLELSNVILTPHAAWNSDEAIPELRVKVAEELKRFFNGVKPINVVNKAVLEKYNFKG
ncbi:MAG: C-terminal binding protein [Synergistaceae bacterium]|nr:C-terminal binding protein [Synergistaceae bacterium]